MKPIWQGSISFGLVSIPVKLFSAINPHVYGFKMLHNQCHQPLTYQRWCTHCNKQVAWQDIVKGLVLDNGKMFIATKEELAQLKPEKSDSIDIIEFVHKDLIKPIYIENHFYLAPKKENEKSFFLFQQALAHSEKVAIGQFVMHEKDYVCTITPYQTTLMLNTLNYIYEIRNIADIAELHHIPAVDKAELKLAQELINKLTKKTFDLSLFKDSFAEQLKKAIAAEKTKKEVHKKTAPSKKSVKKETDLIQMLKASLKKPRTRTTTHSETAHAKSKK